MRRAALCHATLLLAFSAPAVAQVRSFPYAATVETDHLPVHSGPGFYATSHLKKGDRVTVHRHDPGGWYMISPPSGEFSLIRSQAARLLGPDTAEVIDDETIIRVGSRLSNEFSVEQIPLTRGTRVQIARGVAAPPGWLAIHPPRGEYRWIRGRYVIPAEIGVRSQQDADPFALPSNAKRPETITVTSSQETTLRDKSGEQGPRLADSPLNSPAVGQDEKSPTDELLLLDRELEGLQLFEPTEWPLDKLAIAYQRLRTRVPAIGRQVDVRLAQIDKLRLVQEQYVDYVRLTSATDTRDAALMARQTEFTAEKIVHASNLSTFETPERPAAPLRGAGVSSSIPNRFTPATPKADPIVRTPAPLNPSVPAPALPTHSRQRFDAVGTIQATAGPRQNVPKYVLISRAGQIVAFLQQPPGTSLDPLVGQTFGIDGQQQRPPELTAPVIAVERLTPVRF